MKHAVSTLEGPLLDAAVALAEGRLLTGDEPLWPKGEYERLRKEFRGRHVVRWYAHKGEGSDGPETAEVGGWEPIDNWGSPSTDWAIGGPILQRERIAVAHHPLVDAWAACAGVLANGQPSNATGPTPLIAAMRAYCASVFGNEVEIP